MKYLNGILFSLVALILSVTFQILVMIKGWGLEVKSWTWILVIYPIAIMTASAVQRLAEANIEAAKREEKDR